jgi:hypothetical protein
LKTLYEKLTMDLVFFTKKAVLYYNKYYSIKPMFKEKINIYLIQRNIQTKQLNIKLDHKKLGLFEIQKIIRLVNYKLVLPKTINIYPVFYISLLEIILLGVLLVPVTEIELINPHMEYKIKEILDYK